MYLIEDGYPYLDLPLLAEDLEPYPFSFYRDVGDYPIVPGLKDVVANAPYPSLLYAMDGETENGYPFLELPKALKLGMSSPKPYIFYNPDKVKRINYIIVLSQYRQTIPIKMKSKEMI